MKWNKIFLVVVSLIVESVVGQTMYQKGVSIQTLAAQTPAQLCTAANRLQTICNNPAEPCNSNGLVFCTGAETGIPIACPTATPNCLTTDSGDACSVNRGATCDPPSAAAFQCTSIGYFPDPDNCRLFYYCSLNTAGDAIEAEALTCRDGYVFDITAPQTGYCKLQAFSRCNTINCTGLTVPTYVQYGNSRQIYALCIPDSTPVIFSCPTGNVANLSVFPVQCNYQCFLPGLFEYSLNPAMYYECFWNSQLRLQSELKTCPRGNLFNTTTRRCAVAT
ncbi:unnamed protein product [Diamesa tonsa]